jgi:hypothetical protein
VNLHDVLKKNFLEYGFGRTQSIIADSTSAYFVKQFDLGGKDRGFIGFAIARKG